MQSTHTVPEYNSAFDMSVHGSQTQDQQHHPSQHEQSQQSNAQFSFDEQSFMQPSQHVSQPVHKQSHQEGDVDDSGICMNFMDDDLTFAKFGMSGAHIGHEFVSGEINVI